MTTKKVSSDRRLAHLMETHGDVFTFIRDLAHLEGRDDTLRTRTITNGQAMKFRQRCYGWRRAIILELLDTSSDYHKRFATYIYETMGPRVTKAWLESTKFTVKSDGPGYVVEALVERPAYGDDLAWRGAPKPSADDLAELQEMIKQGLHDNWVKHSNGTQVPLLDSQPTAITTDRPPPSGNIETIPTFRNAVLVAGVNVDQIAFDCRIPVEPVRAKAEELKLGGMKGKELEAGLRSIFR